MLMTTGTPRNHTIQSADYSIIIIIILFFDPPNTDMRKAMPRDVHKSSIIPLKRPVTAAELEED